MSRRFLPGVSICGRRPRSVQDARTCGSSCRWVSSAAQITDPRDQPGPPQRWFNEHRPRSGLATSVYELMRDSVLARDAAVDALVDEYFVDADPGELLDELGLLRESDVPEVSGAETEFASRTARYKDLCEKVDIYWSGGRESRHGTSLSARLRRSAAAREAVLLRSRGRCENPHCAGDVQDVTDNGAPILEVDHVHDLAKGGPDRPVQMIALCPNCHAVKTRGRTRKQLQQELFTVAERRHRELFGEVSPSMPERLAEASPT